MDDFDKALCTLCTEVSRIFLSAGRDLRSLLCIYEALLRKLFFFLNLLLLLHLRKSNCFTISQDWILLN